MTIGRVVADAIGSEEELDRAIASLDRLLDKRIQTARDKRKVDRLSTAIRAYEQQHYPEKDLDSTEQLTHLLTIHGLTTRVLSAAVGVSKSKLDGHLADDHSFREEEAKRLAAYFSLTPKAFSSAVNTHCDSAISLSAGTALIVIGTTSNRMISGKVRSREVISRTWGARLEKAEQRFEGASVS
jgi:antitoxin component HigA of HigAB toxin-antitoxin module